MGHASIPYLNSPLVDVKSGSITRDWFRFLHALGKQTEIEIFEVTISQGDVASSGQKTLVGAAVGEQWKVRNIILSSEGNSFGGGGDRGISITDGTSTWSIIPSTTLQNLAISRWGVDTGLPNPPVGAHLFAASVSGAKIVAKYTGGTTDYTVGQATIMLLVERVA